MTFVFCLLTFSLSHPRRHSGQIPAKLLKVVHYQRQKVAQGKSDKNEAHANI
jgi:hypothetical protein